MSESDQTPLPAHANGLFPTQSIAIPRNISTASSSSANHYRPLELDDKNRAVHMVRLSALQHNFQTVESAAARQRCSVIAVVKADGYGHGANATALHLADCCGADAFAVATLDEAISLRKAFAQNPPGRWSRQLTSTFHTQVSQLNGTTTVSPLLVGGGECDNFSVASSSHASLHHQQQHVAAARCRRPTQIRILVLGPPVGFPRCFNDYYHYGIEVMVSGPEVAQSLLTWVANETERRRIQVEKSAMEAKVRALLPLKCPLMNDYHQSQSSNGSDATTTKGNTDDTAKRKVLPHPSSTLSNVSGQDLAREVRAMLLTQKAATDAAEQHQQEQQDMMQPLPPPLVVSTRITSTNPSQVNSSDNSISSWSEENNNPSSVHGTSKQQRPLHAAAAFAISTPQPPAAKHQAFGGIEAVAKQSRAREMAVTRNAITTDSSKDAALSFAATTASMTPLDGNPQPAVATRKALRWHGVVDTGMGRLGFKVSLPKDGTHDERDAVHVIQELVDAEIHSNAPIEFYGMCTHMADANTSNSTFTQSQMDDFISLLQRLRAAGISIPTVSSDNSAALLSTSLTHFDPDRILTQPNVHTRGFVRTGGAIFGQRPAFKELRAVSTFVASVRHVNIIKEGHSVGYDRAYVAPYDIRIATLTVGFADGFPRDLGNGKGNVEINGDMFPIVGKVCMDMIMVALNAVTDLDSTGARVVVGDIAVLWGPMDEDQDDGLVRLQDVASQLGTTQSALTCGLSIRVSRRYV